ncbi:MAG: hypothetical protein LBE12_01230 [Planctomycetaceae bacterium]|nr:hypothetical protein [Planctomycetaceae bacterium]
MIYATEWFDNVQQFDKDLKNFELPESVRKNSQPPKEERYKDRWTNIKLSQPKPGQFFNRRSCSWYMNSKQKDLALVQGLIAFANNNNEQAKEFWDKIAILDKDFYAEQEKAGWKNATTHYRLMQRIKNQPGALFATPDEMASFKDPKRRLAVLLADLYYLAEEPAKALVMYRLIESGNLGTLSYNEKAYICFAIFSCLCWDKSIDEITYLEPKLKAFVGTPSEARVVLGFANRLDANDNPNIISKKIEMYKYLIQKFPETEETEYAIFVLGLLYADLAETALIQQNVNMTIEYIKKIQTLYHFSLKNNSTGPYCDDMKTILLRISTFLENRKS